MKNSFYIFALTAALASTSCSNFLEQEPGTQVSIEEQLSYKEGLDMALAGAYSRLEEAVRVQNHAVYADMQGGNLTFTPTPTGSNRGRVDVPLQIINVYNFQDQREESNLEVFYDDCYEVVNQANLLIENVPNVNDATEEEKQRILAEAYALRGFSHYLLTLVYAQNYGFSDGTHPGVVYVRQSLQEELTYPPRAPINETFDLIEADMQEALNRFQDGTALPGAAYSYFNPTNTKALLARILLSRQDYAGAADLAEEVLAEAGPITPTDTYVSEWEEPVAPISEILFELSPRRDSEGSVGASLAQHYGLDTANSYGDFVASGDLLALYSDEDIRGNLFIEQLLATQEGDDLVDRPYYFTSKFQGSPGYPVIRLSEMHLIAAEAYARDGNSGAALPHLNTIRERAGIPPLSTTEQLLDEVLLERRREFAFEGHLFFDLARNQRSIVRNEGCLSQNCSLDYPSPFYVLPIPQKNINLNQNLEQNEGY